MTTQLHKPTTLEVQVHLYVWLVQPTTMKAKDHVELEGKGWMYFSIQTNHIYGQ